MPIFAYRGEQERIELAPNVRRQRGVGHFVNQFCMAPTPNGAWATFLVLGGDYQGIGLREADGQTRKLLAPRSELSGQPGAPAIGLLVPEKIASGAIVDDPKELANEERLARGTNGFLDFVAKPLLSKRNGRPKATKSFTTQVKIAPIGLLFSLATFLFAIDVSCTFDRLLISLSEGRLLPSVFSPIFSLTKLRVTPALPGWQ